ncbi:M domain protein [Desulfosporosinus fructosivorans]
MDTETKKMFELIVNKLNDMESRQNEIYQAVKAIEHANQVHRAEIDNVKVRADYLEGTFNNIGKVLNTRKSIKEA